MQLASAPRESSGQNERPSMAVQAAPAPPGAPAGVTVFANARKSNNRIILHRTTSAKTRATATLRQHAHTAER